ncbi:MAG: hypothetical protein NZ937_09450, partial [Armatimonadetes bacterium]|nr:hypothetical protein [Armatimonadota bacterium]
SGVDPLGVPEVGDNEFVYEERYEENDVRLLIPVSASIIAGFEPTEDLLQWFSSKLDWKASPRIDCGPVDFLTRLTNGYRGNKIFPRFEDYELVRVEQPGAFPVQIAVVREGLAYGGETLPLDNSGFGRRQIILTFNGQDVHAANIEIFFPATGTKHPEGGPEGCFLIGPIHLWSITVPNWMYYYWQAHPHPQVRYANRGYSFYYKGQDHVHIGNDVINGHAEGIDGLGRRWETYIPEPPYNDHSPVFAYQVYGIDAYVRAVAHELEHKRIYDEYHELIEQASQDGVTLDDPFDDFDGDGLPNFVEEQIGTDPEKQYSLGMDWLDDNELMANLAEHGVFGNKDADWSDLGLNKGTPRQRVLIRQIR